MTVHARAVVPCGVVFANVLQAEAVEFARPPRRNGRAEFSRFAAIGMVAWAILVDVSHVDPHDRRSMEAAPAACKEPRFARARNETNGRQLAGAVRTGSRERVAKPFSRRPKEPDGRTLLRYGARGHGIAEVMALVGDAPLTTRRSRCAACDENCAAFAVLVESGANPVRPDERACGTDQFVFGRPATGLRGRSRQVARKWRFRLENPRFSIRNRGYSRPAKAVSERS